MVVRRLQENPNELYHHGVKGMRWGHRKQRVLVGRRRGRATPYTSSRPVSTSTRTSAASGTGKPKVKMRHKMDKVQRRLGAVVAAGSAASLGLAAYNYYKNKTATGQHAAIGKNVVNNYIQSLRKDRYRYALPG